MIACIIITPVCLYPPLLFFFRANSIRHHPRDIHCPTSVVLYSMYIPLQYRGSTPFRLYHYVPFIMAEVDPASYRDDPSLDQKRIRPIRPGCSSESKSSQAARSVHASQAETNQAKRVPKAALMPITQPSKSSHKNRHQVKSPSSQSSRPSEPRQSKAAGLNQANQSYHQIKVSQMPQQNQATQ